MLSRVAPSHALHDDRVAERRGRGTVLLIHEEGAGGLAASTILRDDDLDVIVTRADGARAVLARHDIDVIVVDACSSSQAEVELRRRIRGESGGLVPILQLSTGPTYEADDDRHLDSRADGCLIHPIDPFELRSSVGTMMRLRRRERDHEAQVAATALLDEALDALGDHIALLGQSGEVLAVNRAWTRFAECSDCVPEGTGLGADYCDLAVTLFGLDAEQARVTAAGLRRVLAGESDEFEGDFECRAPSGHRWFHVSARHVARPGPVVAVVAHSERTAERLAARAEFLARADVEREHAARSAEARLYRSLTEHSREFVSVLDTTGRFKFVSPSALYSIGYTADELLGTSPLELVHPEDRGIMMNTFHKLMEGGPDTTVEMTVRLRRKDGSWGVFEGGGQNLLHEPAVRGITSNARDVTQRVAAERSRFETEARYRRFVETTHEGVIAMSETGTITYVNPRISALLGYAGDELTGRSVFSLMPPDDAFAARTRFARLWRGMSEDVELRMLRHDDTFVDVLAAESPILDARGQFVGVLAMVSDLSERQAAARERERLVGSLEVERSHLAHSEQRLRDQFAKLPVPTYLWEQADDDFVLLELNEAARRTMPELADDVVGQRHTVIFPQRADVRAEMRRCLRDNVVVRHTVEPDASAVHGRRRFELTIGPQQPDRVLVHAVDMTERAELEAQLRQAQKMEAVGRLAGGVAHDFNNLLTVIGAHSAFLMESLDPADPQYEDAVAIQKAGIRAEGLTRQLLAFSRKQILRPQIVDLNATVEDTRAMLARLLGEDIEIVTELADALPKVVADPSQLDQVLMNLAVNARDAMPGGGRLEIATRLSHLTRDGDGDPDVPAGDWVLLTVTDSGTGMEKAVQARLFEPFFTTKAPGQGTGLGLATVYGIVKQSGGHVSVTSAPGEGSTFRVYLPAVAVEDRRGPVQGPERELARGVETILIVEDEPAVRAVVTQVLRRQGYRVLVAEHGHAAIALAAAFGDVIHLVVSDAVMPGMSGAEVVRRLKEMRPAIKTMIVSGYTDDEIVRRGILSSEVAFVQKPFAAADLASAIRTLLDS